MEQWIIKSYLENDLEQRHSNFMELTSCGVHVFCSFMTEYLKTSKKFNLSLDTQWKHLSLSLSLSLSLFLSLSLWYIVSFWWYVSPYLSIIFKVHTFLTKYMKNQIWWHHNFQYLTYYKNFLFLFHIYLLQYPIYGIWNWASISQTEFPLGILMRVPLQT